MRNCKKRPGEVNAETETQPRMEPESHETHVAAETRADDETHAADTSSRKGENRKKTSKENQEVGSCVFAWSKKEDGLRHWPLDTELPVLVAMIFNEKTACLSSGHITDAHDTSVWNSLLFQPIAWLGKHGVHSEDAHCCQCCLELLADGLQ